MSKRRTSDELHSAARTARNIEAVRASEDFGCRLAREVCGIDEQRSHLIVPPAPLVAQQRQVLTTLVEEWFVMTVDERKRMLVGIFDSITASAEGIDRLEPCEDWRPKVIAAISRPVRCQQSGRRGSIARK
jgi:hypothetical protein